MYIDDPKKVTLHNKEPEDRGSQVISRQAPVLVDTQDNDDIFYGRNFE